MAIAIVVAAIAISATMLSYSAFGRIVTSTTTSTSTLVGTSVSVTTTTVPKVQTSTTTDYQTVTCDDQANTTGATTTNCTVGLTLSLSAPSEVALGSNQTIRVSLTDAISVPETVEEDLSSELTLPGGLSLSPRIVDFLLPTISGCFLSTGELPQFVAILNASGDAIQLNDANPDSSICVTSLPPMYSLQCRPVS